jgi:hypothetical protein
MNMLYEGLKENATIVIVPSTAVESMQLGGLAGWTALTMGLGQDQVKATGTDSRMPHMPLHESNVYAMGTISGTWN